MAKNCMRLNAVALGLVFGIACCAKKPEQGDA